MKFSKKIFLDFQTIKAEVKQALIPTISNNLIQNMF